VSVDVARRVADAVLYEGYVLYPYRASAKKNQVRWQFGVLMPRAAADGGSDTWFSQTECLVEPRDDAVLRVTLRFLQLQARIVEEAAGDGYMPVASLEAGGLSHLSWDEAAEHEADTSVPLDELLEGERTVPVRAPGDRAVEPIENASGERVGRIVRQRWPLSATVRLSAIRLDGPSPLVKVRIRTENSSPLADLPAARDEALRHSLLAAHFLLRVEGARFLSLLEPPEWAQEAAAACENLHTYPVLIGDESARDVMLSSPIILYDYPQTAPESPGDLYDSTEIDEILTLRTMALTDEEKAEARLTDARAAAIIERTDAMPPDVLERLHGAVRYVRGAGPGSAGASSEVPWWDPGADASVSPETDTVRIGAATVGRGSRIRLRPGSRRADAQDMFLQGRSARIEAVFLDVDDNPYLAVTLEDDPAAELHQWHGRFLYFNPDEVEPLGDGE